MSGEMAMAALSLVTLYASYLALEFSAMGAGDEARAAEAAAFDKRDAARRAEARRRLKHFEDDLLAVEDHLARMRRSDVAP